MGFKSRFFFVAACVLPLVFLFIATATFAEELPQIPGYLKSIDIELRAKSAIVYDASNNLVLFEKNADSLYSIASLTKIATVYVALKAIEEGNFSLHETLDISPASYANAQPAGSSLLFLGPNQNVTGLDLLYGLTVSSGNDAAHAIASIIAGSPTVFVQQMNELSQSLGMYSTVFVDSSGLGSANKSSARELMVLASSMYKRWEAMSKLLFGRRSFQFPHTENGIMQYNRNTLLDQYDGADGLKTGYTDEAGYTFVASAKRNGRRMIVVLLGIEAETREIGYRFRHEQAVQLMDSAFEQFQLYGISMQDPLITIDGGPASGAPTNMDFPSTLYLHKSQIISPELSIDTPEFVSAPVDKGEIIAHMYAMIDGNSHRVASLTAKERVERAPWWKNIWFWLRRLMIPEPAYRGIVRIAPIS